MTTVSVYVNDVQYTAKAEDLVEAQNPADNTQWTLTLKDKGPVSRTDGGPAVIFSTGKEIFARDGFKHREGDLPAVFQRDLIEEYWIEGRRHRNNNKPAIEFLHGDKRDGETKYYYVNGKLHRTNGPAIDCWDGTLMYFRDGVLTRANDMPAIIGCTGSMFFFHDGILDRKCVKVSKEIRDYPAVILHHGLMMYFRDGKFGRGRDKFAARFACEIPVPLKDGTYISVSAMSESVYDSNEYVSGIEFDFMREVRDALTECDEHIGYWTDEKFREHRLM